MLYPTVQVQNFFKNPDEIVKYSKTLPYAYDSEGRWPGLRTPFIHGFNHSFFGYITRKIMSILYPMTYHKINWTAETAFQSIPANINTGEGWVHQDIYAEFTAIIYLSKHDKCGTSIYKKNNETYFHDEKNIEIKKDYYMNNKPFDDFYYKTLKDNNSNFTKISEFNSIYNSCLIFDGHNYHGADQYYDENFKEDRLTLITFFKTLSGDGLKYSGSELNRI
jgi:hypothetical protein